MRGSPSRHSLGGEARVGWGSRGGSDLFAVEGDRLILRCFRTYSFAPDQVVSIERLGGPTWLNPRVRIVHNRKDYPRGMTFSCRGGSDEVFALLAQAGFVPRGSGPAGRSMLLTAARVLFAMLVVSTVASVLFRLLR